MPFTQHDLLDEAEKAIAPAFSFFNFLHSKQKSKIIENKQRKIVNTKEINKLEG
ncbi:hypothetical protein OAK48_03300 [Deltaproteobacteria bacterium]|nr:hypothetical protein [Deltaproteobacteria bacterium]